MEGMERRERLVLLLKDSSKPISGSQLAKCLGVSRQVIVQDIALLRAGNYEILPTTKGYVLNDNKQSSFRRTFYVNHNNEEIEDELCAIVDQGGKVLDVQVVHPIYGPIITDLFMSNRADVYRFVEKIKQKQTTPLKELTHGLHSHTVEATTEEILDCIEKVLKDKGYLVKQ